MDELIDAATKGDLARVKALLAAKVDVNAKNKYGSFALEGASAQGHLEVVRALLAAGADVNEKNSQGPGGTLLVGGHTALMAAVVSEPANPEVVRALLAAGADVNATDGDYTALTLASQYGSSREVVQLLIAAGAIQPAQKCFTSVCDPNCRMVQVSCGGK